MKTILCSLLMALSTLCYGQGLEGFFGFKFGTSMDSIKKGMLLKPGCKIDFESSTKDVLFFKGITFAGREVQLISFEFANDKFHTGNVILKPQVENKVIELYNDIKADLTQKYSSSSKTVETYDSPYKKGDGNTETAIRLGKAHFSSTWIFKNQKPDKKNFQNSISLAITFKMNVQITYQDGVLFNDAQELKKKRNTEDY